MKKGQILKVMVAGTMLLGMLLLYKSSVMLSPTTANRNISPRESPILWPTKMPTMGTITLDPDRMDACKPRKNLVMLKTHKSGSSTLQNILLRYADRHNLTMVLPRAGHQLSYPSKFNRNIIIPVPWQEYNIFTHHTRFNLPEIMNLMPNDTVYTTILRNPVTQFESLFNYYKLGEYMKIPGPDKLKQFLHRPEKFVGPNVIHRYLQNNYMFDLGFNRPDWERVDELVQKIDDVFDLVLIAEYFDESLIFLRYLMCWDIDDLVYFSVNARKSASVKTLAPWMEDKILAWNSADAELYRHFNESFWRKVWDFGEDRMEREIWALKERLQFYWDVCIQGLTSNGQGVWHLPGVEVQSYRLKKSAENNIHCQQMTKPEIPFTRELADKLKRRIKEYHREHNTLL